MGTGSSKARSGGGGGGGANKPKSRFGGGGGNQKQTQSAEAKAAQAEAEKKMPSVGTKVQSAYIDYVKKQTGIDLTKARETRFDNRNGFNIDVRDLGRNELNAVKRLASQYSGGYNVSFEENGAYRLYIRVRRAK